MTGYSLLLEMERAGLDAGMDPVQSASVCPQGVLPQSEATVVVAFVTDELLPCWKAEPGAIEASPTPNLDPPTRVSCRACVTRSIACCRGSPTPR